MIDLSRIYIWLKAALQLSMNYPWMHCRHKSYTEETLIFNLSDRAKQDGTDI